MHYRYFSSPLHANLLRFAVLPSTTHFIFCYIEFLNVPKAGSPQNMSDHFFHNMSIFPCITSPKVKYFKNPRAGLTRGHQRDVLPQPRAADSGRHSAIKTKELRHIILVRRSCHRCKVFCLGRGYLALSDFCTAGT